MRIVSTKQSDVGPMAMSKLTSKLKKLADKWETVAEATADEAFGQEPAQYLGQMLFDKSFLYII